MTVKIVLSGGYDNIKSFLQLVMGEKLPLSFVVLTHSDEEEVQYRTLITAGKLNSQTTIAIGTPADYSDAELAIMFQSQLPASDEEVDELMLLQANLPIFRESVNEAIENGFTGKLLISGILDEILTYFAWRFTGMDRAKVIGVGTTPQALLLNALLRQQLEVGDQDPNVSVIGRASDPLIAWSRVYIGPAPILMYVANEDSNFAAQDLTGLETQISAVTVPENTTLQGLAVIRIVKALLLNESAILPVTNIKADGAGSSTFASSTPVLVNQDGQTKLTELSLSENEQTQYNEIETAIKALINKIENGGLENISNEG